MVDGVPIGIHRAAIVSSRAVVALPTENPSMGPTLEVVGLGQLGWRLSITDPTGAPVWSVLLVGAGEGLPDG